MSIQKTTTLNLGGSLRDGMPQFPPGAILLGRYRLAAPIGRGGMGIVYRADDLKIGQRVALKFLSPQLEHDPERVARLVAEVRLGRRVAHPNVCRIYDIAEVGSHHFIVMELVEGEDLGSLLERVGRLPQDNALGVARDVCAGLAAAHDQGIIHRDLKPANVMIDSRGRARITDFGIASSVDDLSQRHVVMGTLGYMAPEQARGQQPTPATDVYALGVLLYEVLTGEPPFEVTSIFALANTPPIPPSNFVPDLDPRIETLILRCLSHNAADRPSTARAVLEALPQSDILDAALEAGETPSPEVVAAAGAVGRIPPLVAWTLFLTTIAATALAIRLFERTPTGRLLSQLQSPAAMRARVVALADRVAPGRDRSRREWFGYEPQSKWTSWSPASMRFWYRSGASPPYQRSTTFDDPPHTLAGTVSIEIDGAGHLRRLRYMPMGAERSAATTRDLFAAAGLDVSRFARIPVPPLPLPPVPADHLEAWQARGASTMVLAGTAKGTPVLFEVRDDPQEPMPSLEAETTLDVVVFISLLAFIAVAGAILARRNLNMGRGDARGAARLALFVLAFWLASWNLIASLEKIVEGIAYGVFIATLVWLVYVALEPHVRRRWPRTLVSWNRLLQGRLRDPLVGRDLLAGMFAATVLRLILFFAAGAAGEESPHKATSYPTVLRMLGEVLFYDAWLAVIETFAFLFLLYAATLVLRKRIIALVVVIALLSVLFFAIGGTAVIGVAGVLVMLHRFGLLAGIATCYGLFLHAEMKTFDFARWYGAPSLLAMLTAGALLLWAFIHARAPSRHPLPDFDRGLH